MRFIVRTIQTRLPCLNFILVVDLLYSFSQQDLTRNLLTVSAHGLRINGLNRGELKSSIQYPPADHLHRNKGS